MRKDLWRDEKRQMCKLTFASNISATINQGIGPIKACKNEPEGNLSLDKEACHLICRHSKLT
jgi:hypothetical protein